MQIKKEKILDYLKELKPELEAYGVVQLALFGSFATDKQNVYSDIDIAIRKESDFIQNHTAYDYFNLVTTIKTKMLKRLHRNTDVFDLDSNSSFEESIKKEMIYV